MDGSALCVDLVSADICLDCFQCLAAMSKAPVNILVQVFCGHKLSFLLRSGS